MPRDRQSSEETRYKQVLTKVFLDRLEPGGQRVAFSSADYKRAADDLGVELVRNPPDIIYTFRHRARLPEAIQEKAAPGATWVIRGAGRGLYRFEQVASATFSPSTDLVETKVPDATPSVIEMYALRDEQALLARLMYNRLVDIFTGITCYRLQSHLRTHVRGVGQVETDEVYIGVDRRGAHYVLPVQAKGVKDSLSIVQVEHDFALAESKFPALIPRPVGAKLIDRALIALLAFEDTTDGVRVSMERHYRLVAPDELTAEELQAYRARLE